MFTLEDHCQSGLKINPVKSEGAGLVLRTVIIMGGEQPGSVFSVGVVPVSGSGVKSEGTGGKGEIGTRRGVPDQGERAFGGAVSCPPGITAF